MANELVKRYLGKICIISTGNFSGEVKGEITEVQDNWIEVTDKSGSKILNLDYVTNIRVISENTKIIH